MEISDIETGIQRDNRRRCRQWLQAYELLGVRQGVNRLELQTKGRKRVRYNHRRFIAGDTPTHSHATDERGAMRHVRRHIHGHRDVGGGRSGHPTSTRHAEIHLLVDCAFEHIRQPIGGGVSDMIKGGTDRQITGVLNGESRRQQVADLTLSAMVPSSLAQAVETVEAVSPVQTARSTGC